MVATVTAMFLKRLLVLSLLMIGSAAAAQTKTFIDYFLPTPIGAPLSKTAWGAAAVGPRDTSNGLEDVAMKDWDYWDGKILKGPDGRFHMFASRWEQSRGHNAWMVSKCVHAVSAKLMGPYVDKGLCWPDDQEGKGHNVTALELPDKSYAIVVSESRPGDVFVSKSLDGPWVHLGKIELVPSEFSAKEKMSNVSITLRHDGGFEIVGRSGKIWVSKKGVLGPYTVEGPPIFLSIPEVASHNPRFMEDPVIWYSGGMYHITVNDWNARVAFHLTSVDGINGWVSRGLAYAPDKDFVRYTDGTVNHWNKMERPGVYLENGHVAAVTLAVIDVPKNEENGNDGHGSKIIVIPFDGMGLDRDLSGGKK